MEEQHGQVQHVQAHIHSLHQVQNVRTRYHQEIHMVDSQHLQETVIHLKSGIQSQMEQERRSQRILQQTQVEQYMQYGNQMI